MKSVAILFAAAAALSIQAADPAKLNEVLDRSFSGAEKWLVPAVEAQPAGAFGFKPDKGAFDKVRTFGQQAKHVAAVNYEVAAAILGEKPPVEVGGGDGPEAMHDKAAIVTYLKDSYAYAHKAIAAITEANLLEPVKSPWGAGTTTRLALANILLGHSMDHYGQVAVYLRMNGVVPPASR